MKTKKLICPKCKKEFKAPIMDRKKNIAYGWTLANRGVIVCPSCKYIAPRNIFTGDKTVSDNPEEDYTKFGEL